MQVKIDTKEKFHVITVVETSLAANMTAELEERLLPILQNDVKNVVLILKDIQSIDGEAAETLAQIQQAFYDAGSSFVICELTPAVEESLERSALLEIMNVTPTESEAWDIVQMEEVERELLSDPEE